MLVSQLQPDNLSQVMVEKQDKWNPGSGRPHRAEPPPCWATGFWVDMLEFRKTLFSFFVTLFFGTLFQQQVDLYPTSHNAY